MSSTDPGGTDPIARAAAARLSRRHFLRGLGVAVALPVLRVTAPDSPVRLAARVPVGGLGTTPTGAPLRAAFVYVPNGAIPAAWWPKGEGTNFPVEPHAFSRSSRSRA